MSNKKSNNSDTTNRLNRESATVTTIGNKQINNDEFKNHSSSSNTSSPNTSKETLNVVSQSNNLTSLENCKKSDSTVDCNRVKHLKSAIGSGHFRINPTRVAEKFIMFETLLSTG